MNDFTVAVELLGCQPGGYLRLDEMMKGEGFVRRDCRPDNPHPKNLRTHPENSPHATYIGRWNKDATTLLSRLVNGITKEIQPEVKVKIVMRAQLADWPKIADEVDFAAYP